MLLTDSLDNLKRLFARQLELSLRRAYGGQMPSLATVARDLSLRFPHLPHVSTETVRKWLRGLAIPQSPRMQALATWLGDDLLQALDTRAQETGRGLKRLGRSAPGPKTHPIDLNHISDHTSDHVSNYFSRHGTEGNAGRNPTVEALLESLSASDYELVLKLAESLAAKSTPTSTPLTEGSNNDHEHATETSQR